jgi:Flp pilus assembly protein TadD
VQAAIDRLEYDKALNIAQQIVAKYPKDHYGYEQLGHIVLATGDVKRAESYYMQAYELYPGEATAKTLDALRKRLQNESSKEPSVTK